MAQRLFKEVAWEPRIFSPRPKCGSQSVWRDWASALRIDPKRLARFVAVTSFSTLSMAMLLSGLPGLRPGKHKLS
jgi:hypothetical protein